MEEEIVLPIACRHFNEDDWSQVLSGFSSRGERKSHQRVQRELGELFETIIYLARRDRPKAVT